MSLWWNAPFLLAIGFAAGLLAAGARRDGDGWATPLLEFFGMGEEVPTRATAVLTASTGVVGLLVNGAAEARLGAAYPVWMPLLAIATGLATGLAVLWLWGARREPAAVWPPMERVRSAPVPVGDGTPEEPAFVGSSQPLGSRPVTGPPTPAAPSVPTTSAVPAEIDGEASTSGRVLRAGAED